MATIILPTMTNIVCIILQKFIQWTQIKHYCYNCYNGIIPFPQSSKQWLIMSIPKRIILINNDQHKTDYSYWVNSIMYMGSCHFASIVSRPKLSILPTIDKQHIPHPWLVVSKHVRHLPPPQLPSFPLCCCRFGVFVSLEKLKVLIYIEGPPWCWVTFHRCKLQETDEKVRNL